MKAVIYVRLSLDREGETSTERQEADCRAYCAARGWAVEAVYRDKLSGYKDVRRPGYESFIADLRAGAAGVGVIWKLDRLTRKGVKDIAPLLEALEQGGTALASVNDAIDTSTAMGEGVLALLASIAKQESQNTSLRTRSAKLHAARAGAPVRGGRRPYGYEADGVTVVEEEADVLRGAARRIASGESVYAVAESLRQQAVPAAGGGPWTDGVLKRTLLSERVRGRRAHLGEAYPAQWPAILDPELAEGVELALQVRRSRRVRSYPLAGALQCGNCGQPLISRNHEAVGRRYVCAKVPGRAPRCGKVAVSAARVEEWVETVMRSALGERDVWSEAAGEDLNPLLGELRGLQDRLRVLEDAYFVEGALPKGRFEALKADVLARVAELERRIGKSAAPRPAVGVNGAEAWDAWGPDERRALVRSWFPRIEVGPHPVGAPRSFAPGRLTFVDRDGARWRPVEGPDGWELRPVAGGDPRFLPLGA